MPLSALVHEDPFGGSRAAAPPAPHALVGQLTLHLMIQSDCSGYGSQELAPGLSVIQGAAWDVGLHVAAGPLAGGVAVDTAGDPVANAVIIAGEDLGMQTAVGQWTTTYDAIEIGGRCIVGIGQMAGTGAWVFS